MNPKEPWDPCGKIGPKDNLESEMVMRTSQKRMDKYLCIGERDKDEGRSSPGKSVPLRLRSLTTVSMTC